MKQKFVVLSLILMLLLALAPSALAQGPGNPGRVVFGENLTLAEEEKINGDVVVFGGNLIVPASSEIKGAAAVFGGNVNIDGTVAGEVVAFGGNVNLGETAVVKGDIGLFGGQANIAKGAKVEGNIANMGKNNGGFTLPVPPIPDAPDAPTPPKFEFSNSWDNPVVNFIKDTVLNIMLVIALAGIGWLVATFMPQQMKTVGDTVVDAPVFSFGVGFLSTFICILLAITICLLCIAVPGFLILGVASLFGWIVIGQIIGERLLASAGRPFPGFVPSTVLGVVILTLITNMPVVNWVPCFGCILGFLGWLVGFIASMIGIGAVILTRFGTRPYYKSSYAASGPMPSPRPAPATWTEADLAGLDVKPASEDELKAKIKAALDEADANEEKPKKRTPRRKVTDDETPEPEEPTGDTPEA